MPCIRMIPPIDYSAPLTNRVFLFTHCTFGGIWKDAPFVALYKNIERIAVGTTYYRAVRMGAWGLLYQAL